MDGFSRACSQLAAPTQLVIGVPESVFAPEIASYPIAEYQHQQAAMTTAVGGNIINSAGDATTQDPQRCLTDTESRRAGDTVPIAILNSVLRTSVRILH